MERCPDPSSDEVKKVTIQRNEWIWEDFPDQANAKNSMGWDCVFVAQLYNKMRVKKDILDELMDWALKLRDGLGTSLTIASRGLDVAQAGNALAHKTLDQAARDLNNATDFVSSGYASAKQAGVAKIQDLQNKISSLAQQSVDFQKKINDLNADLATLPLTIAKDIGAAADDACHLEITGKACDLVHTIENVANPEIDAVKGQIKDANNALADIQKNQIKAANDAVTVAQNELSALDDKLQVERKKLASGVLQASFDLARAHLEVQNKLLQHARDRVVELKRADLKLQNYIKTWTGEGTQDAQVPDITDADLEHDRPTPEAAQATICLSSLGTSTYPDDAASALRQVAAPLYNGVMLGATVDYPSGDPSRVLVVPGMRSMRLAAHDTQLAPCAGKPVTLTVYYLDQQVFATELGISGTTGRPLKDGKSKWCGTRTLRVVFDQIAIDPAFAPVKSDNSTANQTYLKLSENGTVLAYTDTVLTKGGVSTCSERLLFARDLLLSK